MVLLNRRRNNRNKNKYDAEIEYLEVNKETGCQYIQTNYHPLNGDIVVKSKVFIYDDDDIKASGTIFFCTPSVGYDLGSSLKLQFAEPITYGILATVPNRFRAIIRNPYYNDIAEIEINGLTNKFHYNDIVGTLAYKEQSETNSNLTLFSTNKDNKPNCRIYFFNIVEEDKLVLDLIPVRKRNKGYMYDKVSRKLFRSVNGGNFILGNDIN